MANICKFKFCVKKQIQNSDFCYSKSHYPSIEEFNIVYNNILNNFLEETIDVNLFNQIKTFENGACLYNSMIKFLLLHKDNQIIKNNQHFVHLIEKCGCDETLLTKELQNILYLWIINNLDKNIENCDTSIKDMILIAHFPYIESIDDYIKYYTIYAGDNDYIISEKNNKKINIPTRWGSLVEIYAFKELFNVNVFVYNKYKFVKRLLNVTICSDKEKSIIENIFRYKLCNKYIYDENSDLNINLLFLSGKNHYLYLHKK